MISFATPPALLALLALAPMAAAAAYVAARHRAADAAFGGDDRLRRGRSTRRRRLRTVLLLTSVTLVALALARPQWGTAEQPLIRRGIDVAIALDVSRSMTATDVAPTRAGAAAGGLSNMLDHLRGDRVGLVTFSASAFVRSPLTLDLEAIRQLVSQAQGEAALVALVRPGTNLGGALEVAITLLGVDDPAETQVILLVSDGEDLASDRLDAALRRARDGGFRVYTAAAGTEGGADLPTDESGGTELSRLDRATLERIASETGGDLREVSKIAGLAVEFARLRQSQFAVAEQPAPVERIQWFLGAALLLLLAQSAVADGGVPAPLRVGRISLGSAPLAGLLLLACGGGSAYRDVSDGNNAYAAGSYDEALGAYRAAAELLPDDPAIAYNIGNALHRLRRFEEATAASSAATAATEDAALLQRATYALGSHAFRRDALEEAREAFVSVLLRDPDDHDARHNLELVLVALAPPQLASPSQTAADGAEQGEGGDGLNGGNPQPGREDQGGDGDDGPSETTDGTAPGEPGAEGAATTLEAAQQALEASLAGFGEEVTLEQALEILDLLRRVNALASLEPSRGGGGLLPPR